MVSFASKKITQVISSAVFTVIALYKKTNNSSSYKVDPYQL